MTLDQWFGELHDTDTRRLIRWQIHTRRIVIVVIFTDWSPVPILMRIELFVDRGVRFELIIREVRHRSLLVIMIILSRLCMWDHFQAIELDRFSLVLEVHLHKITLWVINAQVVV